MERLNGYILDNIDSRYIENDIATKGINEALAYRYNLLDCTRTMDNGMRIMQTINYTYKNILSEFKWVFDNYDESVKNEWLEKIVQRHISNLCYEREVPPIKYAKKSKVSNKNKINKATSKVPKERKESKAESKLKAHALKLNMLKLKIQ